MDELTKGLNISIQADTVQFDRQMKDVNADLRSAAVESKRLQNSLKYDTTSLDLLTKKEANLTKQLTLNTEKQQMLQKQLAAMDASGVDKTSSAYKNQQTAIERTYLAEENLTRAYEANAKAMDNLPTAKLEADLKNVDNELQDVQKHLKMDPTDINLLTQQFELLGQKEEITTSLLKEYEASLNKLGDEDIGSDEWERLQQDMRKTERTLNSIQKETTDVSIAMALASDQNLSKPYTEANVQAEILYQKQKKIGGQFTAAGSKIKGAGQSMQIASFAAAAGVGVATASFVSFDDAMLQVKANTGATTEEFEMMTDAALEMGATTRYSATDAANALYYLTSAGLDCQEAVDALPAVLELAAAGNMDLATSASLATSAMSQWGIGIDELTGLTDIWVRTSQLSNTTIEELARANIKCAGTAHTLGYSIEDTNTVLAIMANNGYKGAEAGNALSKAMLELADPTSEAAKELDALGVAMFDEQGNAIPLIDVMAELQQATKDMSAEEKIAAQSSLFSTNAFKKMAPVLNTNTEEMYALKDSIEDCDGSTTEFSETMESGLGGSLRETRSAVEGMAISLGESLAPQVEFVADGIADLATGFTELSPIMQTVIGDILVLTAVAGPVLIGIGLISTGIGSVIKAGAGLSKGIGSVSKSITGIGTSSITAEAEVATSTALMDGEIAAVGGASLITAGEVESIGTTSIIAEGEVAGATTLMDGEIATVGGTALVTAGEVESIGTAAFIAEGQVATATTLMSGEIAGVGTTAVIAGSATGTGFIAGLAGGMTTSFGTLTTIAETGGLGLLLINDKYNAAQLENTKATVQAEADANGNSLGEQYTQYEKYYSDVGVLTDEQYNKASVSLMMQSDKLNEAKDADLQTLNDSYAAGEISDEEYHQKLKGIEEDYYSNSSTLLEKKKVLTQEAYDNGLIDEAEYNTKINEIESTQTDGFKALQDEQTEIHKQAMRDQGDATYTKYQDELDAADAAHEQQIASLDTMYAKGEISDDEYVQGVKDADQEMLDSKKGVYSKMATLNLKLLKGGLITQGEYNNRMRDLDYLRTEDAKTADDTQTRNHEEAVNKRYTDEKDSLLKQKDDRTIAYEEDVADLNRSYKNKEISAEEYNAKLKDLNTDYLADQTATYDKLEELNQFALDNNLISQRTYNKNAKKIDKSREGDVETTLGNQRIDFDKTTKHMEDNNDVSVDVSQGDYTFNEMSTDWKTTVDEMNAYAAVAPAGTSGPLNPATINKTSATTTSANASLFNTSSAALSTGYQTTASFGAAQPSANILNPQTASQGSGIGISIASMTVVANDPTEFMDKLRYETAKYL